MMTFNLLEFAQYYKLFKVNILTFTVMGDLCEL